MKPIETLCLYDGWLCLKSVDTDSEEPKFHIRYWPMFRCNQHDANMASYPLGSQMHNTSPGVYSPNTPDDHRFYHLKDGGQTMPIMAGIIPANQPKSNKRVRWYYGRWQKLLKSGWVELPFASVP